MMNLSRWSWTFSRILLLICLVVFLGISLSRPAAAEGLVDALADVDDSEYYSFSSTAREALYYSLFGVRFSGSLSNLSLDGVSASNMTFADNLRSLLYALNGVYSTTESLSRRITALETSSGLDFWLERIDTNTASLHGDLLNIQQALGWSGSSSMTIWQLLESLLTNLQNMCLEISLYFAQMPALINQGFEAVNTRQDAFSTLFSSNGKFRVIYQDRANPRVVDSFSDWLFWFSKETNLASTLVQGYGSFLGSSGTLREMTCDIQIPFLLQQGLMGLSSNLAGGDKVGSFTTWRGPDQTAVRSANNILDMIALLGAELQGPLAKLQYVWADDDDIRIADKNQPVKDEIEDNFVGDGEAAVKPSDISGVAGLTSGVKDTFSGAGDILDVFSVLGDVSNYNFFSQAVADALDTTQSPSVASAEDEYQKFLDSFWVDESGVAHSRDTSLFNLNSYLEAVR